MDRGEFFRAITLLTAAAVLAAAAPPWRNEDAAQWSSRDLDIVLGNSPWAQPTPVAFSLLRDDRTPDPGPLPGAAQAGLAGPRGVNDGRWDGGVGRPDRNNPPVLTVVVRWDSALPVRVALEREHSGSSYTPEQVRRDYIITVIGLVPGHNTGPSGPDSRSSSDDPRFNSDDPLNSQHLAETMSGVMRFSRLLPKGKPAISPEDAKLDSATGTLHIFFPRVNPISASDKEILFEMRFGSLALARRFRLKDMLYKGQLEL